MSKIFITGALGTLGSNLILELIKHDYQYEIIATGRHPSISSQLLSDISRLNKLNSKERLCYYFLDITDQNSLSKLLIKTQPDYIIHLAANLNVSRDFNLIRTSLEVNFLPIIPILEYSFNHNVKRLILTGTCEEYGHQIVPFHENQELKPVSPYSWAKSLSAITTEFMNQIFDLPVVFLRPFTFFGPYQRGTMFIPALFRAILHQEEKFPMSKGDQIREFNYAPDIANAYIKALSTANIEGEIINLGRGNGFNLSEVADLIVNITRSKILLQKGALPYRKQELLAIVTDTKKSEQLLGWKATTSIEEGLSETYHWYQRNPDFL